MNIYLVLLRHELSCDALTDTSAPHSLIFELFWRRLIHSTPVNCLHHLTMFIVHSSQAIFGCLKLNFRSERTNFWWTIQLPHCIWYCTHISASMTISICATNQSWFVLWFFRFRFVHFTLWYLAVRLFVGYSVSCFLRLMMFELLPFDVFSGDGCIDSNLDLWYIHYASSRKIF